MEKSAAKTRRLCAGLLAFVLVELASIIAPQKMFGAVSWQYLQSLRLRKTEKYFFTAQDCSFAVNIENVSPDKISAAINDVPQGASFVSMKKENYAPSSGTSESYGTRLIMTFRFSMPGSYQFRAIDVQVDTWWAHIPFETVYVYENPSIVQPSIKVTFDDSRYSSASRTLNMAAGQHLKFTLNIRYATQVYDLTWKIPENSLFMEVESYDITRQNITSEEFNPNTIPVAKFDWQPLAEGVYSFPKFSMTAMSLGGIRYNVEVPMLTEIKVGPPLERRDYYDDEEPEIYANAFSDYVEQSASGGSVYTEVEDIDALLELHKAERRSIPIFSAARTERREIERGAGLNSAVWEPSVPLLIVIAGIFVVLVFLAVLLFVLKKIPAASVCLAFSVVSLALGLFYARWTFQKIALYTGGEIAQIPEEGSGAGVSISKGSVVHIQKETGDWSYIRCNDTYGWVMNDTLLVID
ncbi:MAG: hypothetical protein IKQ66_02530 [Treponema sp.]|nr:hypothetical protein [Treponema sp.]